MTTGRINQVATVGSGLPGRCGAGDSRLPAPATPRAVGGRGGGAGGALAARRNRRGGARPWRGRRHATRAWYRRPQAFLTAGSGGGCRPAPGRGPRWGSPPLVPSRSPRAP